MVSKCSSLDKYLESSNILKQNKRPLFDGLSNRSTFYGHPEYHGFWYNN